VTDLALDDSLPPPDPGDHEPRPRFRDRVWLHVLLFVLTCAATTFVGLGYYSSFLSDLGTLQVSAGLRSIGYGAWFSVPLMTIITAHEFGHYLACRRYGIDASLPYYLPMIPLSFLPLGILSGTLGAVIRIREPIYSKRALFDMAIAGPIAGFVVAVPALFLGMWLSKTGTLSPGFGVIEFGEPLGFRLAQYLTFGGLPSGVALNAHPTAMAAWWGLFLTMFNLIPVLQLDGGHIAYAVLGRRSAVLTQIVLVFLIGLAIYDHIWALPAAILGGLVFWLGPHHPPVLDEDLPLDRTRRRVATLAVVMFVFSFTPVPIQILLSN